MRPRSSSSRRPSLGDPAQTASDQAALTRQRAVDAVVWGTPIVGFEAMRRAYFRDAAARYNDIVFWSRPADWMLQIATPDASSLYVIVHINTSDGPVVLEVPPTIGASLFGSILDAWQVPAADVGPHGEDRGRGGTYVILPPAGSHPDLDGAIPVRLPTFNGYIALRAIPDDASDASGDRALELVRGLRVYPAHDGVPPRQRLIDMTGKSFDAIVRFDDTFFDALARMIDEEPTMPRDADDLEQLALLGIDKGARFRPDATLRHTLADAARAAHVAYVRAAPYDGRVFWRGRQWRWPSTLGAETGFTFVTEHGLDASTRGLFYFLACAPPAKLGKATAYLTTFVDSDGKALIGDHTYRLRVPPNVPAKQLWAATVYDASTAGFIRESPRVEINSYDRQLVHNPDGSVDLYFGPRPPPDKEANWAYVRPGEMWFATFRLYGPTDPLSDRTWQLGDFELMSFDQPQLQGFDDHGWFSTETLHTRVGDLVFVRGYPAVATVDKLYEQRLFQRAVEVYLAQLPALSIFHLTRGLAESGIDAPNKVLIFEHMIDSSTLLLTASSETVYALACLDLRRDGPTVVEVPATVLGGAADMWQRNLVDMGLPGPDQGRGGKYLFLPPGEDPRGHHGYFAVPCTTYGGYVGVRAFLVDGKPDRAVELLRTMKIYPLSQAAQPPPMVFIDGSGKQIDTIFPDTYEFFPHLAELVQREPIEAVPEADRFYLSTLGIEKGMPFMPDDATKAVLTEAARVGAAMARVQVYASRDPASPVYPDRRWEWAFLGGSPSFDVQGYVNTDRRAAWCYAALGSSPAMVLKMIGSGSQYLWTPRDATGAYLDGGKHYRLHLPAGIPAERFWSIVVYDASSRSELQTPQGQPIINTYSKPASNPDGSIDIYFGPVAPSGREHNWIQTVPGKGWFPYLRFYSPTRAFFDKTWRPDDIVPWAAEAKAA